jgi:hypothetical protein
MLQTEYIGQPTGLAQRRLPLMIEQPMKRGREGAGDVITHNPGDAVVCGRRENLTELTRQCLQQEQGSPMFLISAIA